MTTGMTGIDWDSTGIIPVATGQSTEWDFPFRGIPSPSSVAAASTNRQTTGSNSRSIPMALPIQRTPMTDTYSSRREAQLAAESRRLEETIDKATGLSREDRRRELDAKIAAMLARLGAAACLPPLYEPRD